MFACCRRWLGRVRRHPLGAAAVLVLLAAGAYFGRRHLGAYADYRAARRCLDRYDFGGALERLDSCLEVWPGSASAHLLAARAARRTGQPVRAQEHLEACRRLGGPAERVVLEGYLLRAQQGDLAGVEKKLLAFVRRGHPDTPFVLDVLTERWMLEHRLGEARTYLDLWLRLEPDSRPATVRQAWVSEHLFQPREAADGYRRALELDPERDRRENDRVRLRLADLLLQTGHRGEALGHFETLYERQPDNPAVALGLARCRRLLGEAEGAAQLLDALLARDPGNGQALGERGRLALEQGRAAEAERWLRRAAGRCPRDREILHSLYLCLQKNGRHDEARKYQELVEQVRADERRMQELMEEVLRSPEDPSLRYRIGTIFLRNRLDEDGRRWLLSALALDPGHAPSHRALARHYEGLGDEQRALPHRAALQQLGSGASGASPEEKEQ